MAKLVVIEDALPSDNFRFGGQVTNQLVLLLTGTNLDSEEDIRINTTFKFYSGKLALYDNDPTLSHKVFIKVENIATGLDKSITIRDPTVQDDFFMTESQNQVVKNKTFSTGNQVTADLTFVTAAITGATISGASNTLSNIGQGSLLQITDKAKLPSPAVYTDQNNTYSDFNQLFRNTRMRIRNPANTFSMILDVPAITADRTVSFPLISANDTFALLGVTNVFSAIQKISNASQNILTLHRAINTQFNTTGIAFNLSNSTPSEVTYAEVLGGINNNTAGNEQGYIYFRARYNGTIKEVGLINQIGQFGGTNPNNFRLFIDPVNSTAHRTLTAPDLSGQIVLQEHANIFTEVQTIQKNTQDLLSIYRLSQTTLDSIAVTFDAWSSTGAKRTYGRIRTRIEDPTNLSEDGNIHFELMSNGTLATSFIIHGNGNIFIGRNNRLVLTETGLTAQRIMTFPDITGKVAVDTFANLFVNKQKIQWNGSADQLTLLRGNVAAVNSLGGLQFSALNAGAGAELVFASILGGTGNAAADIVAGTERGQLQLQILDGGSLVTKVQIRATTFTTVGMVPIFEVGASDLNSMFIYRPVASSGSNLINFDLQNVSAARRTFGYVGARSETVTAGAEVGSIQLGAMEGGTIALQAKLHSHKLSIYNTSGVQAIIDPVGLSTHRTFTFPDQSGQITLNTATQTLSNKTFGSGISFTSSISANTANGLHVIKTAGSGVAEILARFEMADNSTSYLQIDNGTTTDALFVPRITSISSQGGNPSAVGLYMYVNIDATSDTTDSTNAVTIFDSRRSNSTAIQFKRLFQFRNAGTNVLDIYTNQVSFNNNKIVNAVLNVNEITLKNSGTNAEGDILVYKTSLSRYDRIPAGSNNQFIGVAGGVVGYYTPVGVNGVLALAGLTDDVQITSLADNHILRYNAASGKWKNVVLDPSAGLVSNIGTGVGIFKQLAATNELKSLTEGLGVIITGNTNDVSIGVENPFVLPSAQNSLFRFQKPNSGATGAERLVAFSVDDDANSELTIENLTGNQNTFAPALIGTQYTNNAIGGLYLMGRIDPSHDIVNEVGAIQLNARLATAPIVNRPLVEINDYNVKEYLFYATYADFKNNELRNAAIHSSVTGIVNANIASGANIAISKINVAGGLASTTSAGFVELAENLETAANVVVQGSDSRLADARVPLAHANSHQFGAADALNLAYHAAFDFIIWKNGTTYYIRDNKTGIVTSNANPDTIFQAALTAGGSTYVFAGDYTFQASGSVVLTMPVSPVSAELYLSASVNLIVPQGYTGVLLQFKHAAVGSAGVTRCKISGGNMKEAGTRQELWTAIQFYGNAGVSVAGVYWNTVEDVQIYYPKKGIHLLNDTGGTKCFFNANVFRKVVIWYPKDDGVHFDMQTAYIASTNGFHRNRFEYVTIQGAGRTTNPNATVGFRDIRQIDNTFIGCYPVDFTGDSKTATIHSEAVATVIIGGSMDALGFTDASTSTIRINQNGRVTTNGINPSNGNNLDTFQGVGQTTLTWSFWKNDLSERFYFQKNDTNGQYLFDFVRQSAGGALRPVLFRQLDAVGGGAGTVESFRIETDATLQVAYSKFVLKDVNGQKITIVPADVSADRQLNIPALTGTDTIATLGLSNTFTAQQIIAAGQGYPIVLYRNTISTSLGVAVSFELDNATPTRTQYAAIVGNVAVSTAGAESGVINFQTKNAGTLATRMQLNHVGNVFFGTNLRLCFTETGLSAQRIISFPDSDQTLLGRTDTATITNKTINGLKINSNSKTASYTALATDDYIPCSPAANMTITLPPAASSAGSFMMIQKIDASAFTVTIDGNASEQINGALTMVLTAQYQSVTLLCNGTAWFTTPYSVERRGRSTANGTGAAVTFNVPHGLGVNPHDAIITCSSHTIALSYTTDATNIIVTFASAPPSGTNNVIFHWSAVP